MRTRVLVLAAAMAALVPSMVHAGEPEALAELKGLWFAKARYGPDIRGRVVLARDGDAFTAEIAGLRATCARGAEMRFEFGDSALRVRQGPDGSMLGFWVQPPSMVGGPAYATAVELAPRGDGVWLGDARPLDDEMTMWMPVAVDGERATAFLRNPERNVGLMAHVQRLEREGNSVRLLGRMGPGSADGNVELASGVFDPNNERLVMNFARFGVSMDFSRSPARGFLPRESGGLRAVTPPRLDDGWPVGTIESAGLDRAALETFLNQLASAPMDSIGALQVHAVLVARNGVLVFEEYFHGYHRDMPHDTRSASKSITSFLVGASMDRLGFDENSSIVDLVDPALLPPALDGAKRSITVGHLLTMSSGLACDDSDSESPGNEDAIQSQRAERNWWKYTLALPMAHGRVPGDKAVYASASPNLLGAALSHQSKQWLPDLFRGAIAEPMGIRRFGVNLAPNGDAYLGGGMALLPRDFLKFAQLVLDRGRWEGVQVVPESFVARAIEPRFDLNGVGYGSLWWSVQLPYQGRTVRAIYAGGNGGQVAMAIPELSLAIVFLGGSYSDPVFYRPQREFVPAFILPAVKR